MRWAASPGLRGTGQAPLVATNPAAALALADDLARLMDDMTTRQVTWQRLDDLVPDELDQYWQHTLDFLKIAREHWPAMLAERGAVEPAERRDLLIEAEAKRITLRPDGPVIAAGSTGSMPATAALIATIATLPHGAVVLPGLDTDLDPESWELIAGKNGDREDSVEIAPAASHPQFAMQALLRRIGIARDNVVIGSGRADLAMSGIGNIGNCFTGNVHRTTIPWGLEILQGCGRIRVPVVGDLNAYLGSRAGRNRPDGAGIVPVATEDSDLRGRNARDRDRGPLTHLAGSTSLWERRIAIVARRRRADPYRRLWGGQSPDSLLPP
jgi:hypothetical protein